MSDEILNPTPPYKGLMMLQSISTRGMPAVGWSESLWINKPSFEQSLAALKSIAEKRLLLLPSTVRVRVIRVTNPHVPRASSIEVLETVGKYDSSELPRGPGVCLLLRFDCKGYHTTYHLDGLPKGLFRGTAIDEAPDVWKRAFKEYTDAIIANCVIVNRKHASDKESTEAVVNPIESILPQRISTRKRGRPFFMTRGRRRA